ncbi:MAG: hypothetical protein AAFQ41_05390 [Cyanobacteria bacterium J06623_7]
MRLLHQIVIGFLPRNIRNIVKAIALASCYHPNIVHIYPQVFQEEGA